MPEPKSELIFIFSVVKCRKSELEYVEKSVVISLPRKIVTKSNRYFRSCLVVIKTKFSVAFGFISILILGCMFPQPLFYVSNTQFMFPNCDDVSKRQCLRCMFPIFTEPSRITTPVIPGKSNCHVI